MQWNYHDLPRINRQKRWQHHGQMRELAIRGSAATAAAIIAAAAAIIAAAASPRPCTAGKLRRRAQRPGTRDILKREILGVQHGVLAAR